ncbi:hypothetical protein DFA_07091 [Cavenderia fasciculata]|uniref:F-box domain-containing protein n=1 Tax=Cavenderia fasciculata TaxID=261658 RepID=F4PVG3_CACFS|nr:uncharacterized protein DFA_07091 [Cavenderia fasciculata]EGG19977.1 hypothetical protein DFA_07091 [Cavenderia fasciculata]|eukprot:XP_004366960.1 hypothetical protein DFA_07091 [Cavenderia fasciculata]
MTTTTTTMTTRTNNFKPVVVNLAQENSCLVVQSSSSSSSSSTFTLNIFDLPDEIILYIFSTKRQEEMDESLNVGELNNDNDDQQQSLIISVSSIIQFSSTCKCFYTLFQDERFWMKLYKNRFQFNSTIDMDNLCLNLNQPNNNNNNSDNQNVIWKNRFKNRTDPWDMTKVMTRKEIVGSHQLGVTALTVDDTFLYSGSHDTSIKLYDMGRLEPIHTLTGHAYTIWALKSNGSNRLYSGSNDQTIRVWNLKLLKDNITDLIQENEIEKEKEKYLDETLTTPPFSSSNSTSPIIISKPSPYCKKVIETNTKVFSIELKDRALFYSNGESISVLNNKTFDRMAELNGHLGGVNTMTVHGHHLLTGSNDKTVRVWDTNTMQCVTTREDPMARILSLAIVDQNTLATGSNLYHIRLWDLRSREVMNTIANAHKWEVWQLHMCGDVLFSGSFDHTIKTWDLRNLVQTKSLTGHRSYIHALTSSSFHLFSGSADKSIKVWN